MPKGAWAQDDAGTPRGEGWGGGGRASGLQARKRGPFSLGRWSSSLASLLPLSQNAIYRNLLLKVFWR